MYLPDLKPLVAFFWVSLVVAWPLGIWKLGELIWWFFSHVSWS